MQSKVCDELLTLRGNDQVIWVGLHPHDKNSSLTSMNLNIPRFHNALDEDVHKRWPLYVFAVASLEKFKKNIDFNLRELVVSKTQVGFVESQCLPVDLSAICSSMAVGAQSNQVFVFMLLALFPRDNVMYVDLNVSASRDSTAMSCLDEDSPSCFCRGNGVSVQILDKILKSLGRVNHLPIPLSLYAHLRRVRPPAQRH